MLENFMEVIDFIRETNLSIDTVQYLIKYHRLNTCIVDGITYIRCDEVSYFKNYYEEHKHELF